jgi:acyl-coenzyme A synthetase/AMP-(fatty) acid ligase
MVRDTGGYATALKWSMDNFYSLNPGDTFWTASDIGWVVGMCNETFLKELFCMSVLTYRLLYLFLIHQVIPTLSTDHCYMDVQQ